MYIIFDLWSFNLIFYFNPASLISRTTTPGVALKAIGRGVKNGSGDVMCTSCVRDSQRFKLIWNVTALLLLLPFLKIENVYILSLENIIFESKIVSEHLGRVHNVILIKCIFRSGRPRGVGILDKGSTWVEWGEQRVSLQATGSRGGRILSQQGGLQVSGQGEQGE